MQVILPQPVADYLAGHNVMTLATQGAAGPGPQPCSTPATAVR